MDHVDIVAAYLNAELREDMNIEIPDGFLEASDELRTKYKDIPEMKYLQDGRYVIKLKKCIYGLRQSGREWNDSIDKFLKAIGMKQCVADPCVYYLPGIPIIVTVQVDDLLLFGKRSEINEFKSKLQKEFETRDLWKATYVQSIRIRYGKDEVHLDQTNYLMNVLRDYEMENCRPVKTHVAIGLKLSKTSGENTMSHEQKTQYQMAIGSLLYLSTGTLPDIAFAVSYLSQFSSNPSIEHWQAVKHLFRYLQGSKEKTLTYKRSKEEIKCFTDADWASDVTDRKSFGGYISVLARGAISWSCKKQTLVSLSTVESEFIALREAVRETLWMRALLREIQQSKFCANATKIFIDNQGAMALAQNKNASERTKHLDIRSFFHSRRYAH